jgi:hypothetical protein
MLNTSTVNAHCGFAYPGTFGHECNAPATLTAVFPSRRTRSGFYYAARCERCASIHGGENAGVLRIEMRDPSTHVNDWQ